MSIQDELIIEQIEIGPMANFTYILGSRETREVVIVDPAWDIDSLLSHTDERDYQVVGALATHYHPDHVGGSMMQFSITGVAELLELVSVPVHVQADEAQYVTMTTGIGEDDLCQHASGDVLSVGAVDIEMIHTPGHTPGSQCFLTNGRLVAGDTLFLEGCGRTDLPGSDPTAMYESLTQRLARVPDSATLYPGHLYSPQPSASMGETRRTNYVFMPRSPEQWLAMFGG